MSQALNKLHHFKYNWGNIAEPHCPLIKPTCSISTCAEFDLVFFVKRSSVGLTADPEVESKLSESQVLTTMSHILLIAKINFGHM